MTRAVVAVGPDAPFKGMVTLMRHRRIGGLPVVEAEGRVVGVVSEADLLPKEEFRDSDPDRLTQLRRMSDLAKAGGLTASDVMSAPAVTVRPDASLAAAAAIMARRRIQRLPVVGEGDRLEGVVSRSDLLGVFLRSDEEIAEEVRAEIIPRLFPGAAEHVRVRVREGEVTLVGRVSDTSLIPPAARLVRAVEGVVDVECHLSARAEGGPGWPSPSSP